MQFAINYSPQAADLLARGQISVDRFKCPPWPDLLAEARTHAPVYVHFDLRADPNANRALDFEEIARFYTDTNTPYLNLHLTPARQTFPDMAHDTTDPRDIKAVTEALLTGVWIIVEEFGVENVIVENLPYHGGRYPDELRPVAEADVIRRIVEETGCGFLLDISHGRLAARHMGLDERDYLARLPGSRLRELHVTGIGSDPAGLVCDHLGLSEEDWPFVTWVLDRIRAGEWATPEIMAFEYGGIGPVFEWRSDAAVIAAQAPRLAELAHSL